MALVTCPECSSPVSTTARACAVCGCRARVIRSRLERPPVFTALLTVTALGLGLVVTVADQGWLWPAWLVMSVCAIASHVLHRVGYRMGRVVTAPDASD